MTAASNAGPGGNSDSLNHRLANLRLVAFDFDGVFTDNCVYVLQDGNEAVRCWRGDGLGLRKLDTAGIASVIISTETNPVVTARSTKLRVRCIQGCEDKEEALIKIASEMGIGLAEVAFVGNDINDARCLASVGVPIVVADAHPDVLGLAAYRTVARGGFGAVREVCDLVAAAAGGAAPTGAR